MVKNLRKTCRKLTFARRCSSSALPQSAPVRRDNQDESPSHPDCRATAPADSISFETGRLKCKSPSRKFASPGERLIKLDDVIEKRKVDIRLFVYDGKILLTAVRIYQGQTTNSRTPGGGFAPVFTI